MGLLFFTTNKLIFNYVLHYLSVSTRKRVDMVRQPRWVTTTGSPFESDERRLPTTEPKITFH